MRCTNLDMDALRSFVSGVEAGSFADAANRLGRSTSAVSAQLKKLEEQTGVSLLRKSGRKLALTENGETLLSYARQLLTLNDKAMNAVRGVELEGWVRLGLQEDFGESLLPNILGRFAQLYPKVQIEGRIARNDELLDRIASGHLDLALAWGGGHHPATAYQIAKVPLCWLGAEEYPWADRVSRDEPLPLVVLDAPCLLRTIACEHLDTHGLSWRVAFVSPGLGGLWAATAAGLGIALRTPIGRPSSVRILAPETLGLPLMPSLGLVLHRASQDLSPTAEHLASIITQSLQDALPENWLVRHK